MKWINVDEKLPPVGVDLIVYGKNKHAKFRNGDEIYWHVNLNPKVYDEGEALKFFLTQFSITHYIILSQIPKT